MGKDPIVHVAIEGNPKLKKYGEELLHTNTPVFMQGDMVRGTLEIQPQDGPVSHKGVQILLVGEFRKPNGDTISRIFTRKQELLPIGEISTTLKTNFTFDNLKFPTSSYKGTVINVVYAIQLIIHQRFSFFDFKTEKIFTVLTFNKTPDNAVPQHNEVGIKNVLLIEFIFPNPIIDCTDVLLGSVYFLLVKLRIVSMKLSLIRVETYISDDIYFRKKTVLKEYEVMDGPPVRGDHIPIRFFLGDCDLWPYDEFKGSLLTVSYTIKATLVDENGKNYFKRLNVDIKRLLNEKFQ